MPFIRREWTASDADEWTREDAFAIILSPIIYILMTLGAAYCFLNMIEGYVMVAVSVVLYLLMNWIIDPKMKAISEEYEKQQQAYLQELEAAARWKNEP